MRPEEYAAQQSVISAAVASSVLQFGKLFSKPALALKDWLSLLNFLFPAVQAQREASARLARSFYDAQRAEVYPSLPVNPRYLETYTFDRFVVDMEPARKRMSMADSPDDAIGQVALQAVRSVENAGRQQIIHAVEDDPALQEFQASDAEVADLAELRPVQQLQTQLQTAPKPVVPERVIKPARASTKVVRGWARVATGRETCSWCLMLVSRGPTYLDSGNAALKMSNTEALRAWDNAAGDLESFFDEITPYMQQWHAGCDCKVVPVFKQESDWVGRDASVQALSLWNQATLTAIGEEDDPGVHTNGANKGKRFTRNQLALNALRRRLDSGDISSSHYAALDAA